MNNDIKIKIENLWKSYRVYARPMDFVKEVIRPSQYPLHKRVDALQDINLLIRKGERVGILGENGSGKSTLLKLIAGVVTQSSGSIAVEGRVSALLELGTGFGSELTGLENIYQYGLLQGLTRTEIEAKIDDIIGFSELEDAIHQTIRTYSSGMKLRLGFSCAVFSDPDIFIVDEALSVGDGYFQFKCLQKIKSMLERNITFIYVSHSHDSVRALCQRGVLLHHGRVVMDDNAGVVAAQYRKRLFEKVSHGSEAVRDADQVADESALRSCGPAKDDGVAVTAPTGRKFRSSPVFERRVAMMRAGNGDLRIFDVVITDDGGQVVESVPFGARFSIDISFVVYRNLRDLAHLAVDISDSYGNTIVHLNTIDGGLRLCDYRPGSRAVISFRLENRFCPGGYFVSVLACGGERHPYHPATLNSGLLYDYCIGGASIEVPRESATESVWGIVHIPYTAEWVWTEQPSSLSPIDEIA